MNAYKTLAKGVCAEYILKRSRFLCYVKPVSDEENALAFIREIAAKHWDASHNVWAYALREGQRLRYSDDGEPQGTAGLPVLEAMRSRKITDAAIVVTRYFGGVKLGASGLTRAYAHSAGRGLEEAEIVTMRPCVRMRLTLPYSRYAQFERLLASLGGIAIDIAFAETVTATFDLPEEMGDRLTAALAVFAAGNEPKVTGRDFIKSNINE